MTDELISQPTEMQRMRIIIEETLDAQDAVIDRLNRKIATDRIALGAVGVFAGLAMFGSWQTMKALKNLSDFSNSNFVAIKEAFQEQGAAIQAMNVAPVVPTNGATSATNGPTPVHYVAPPAEGPRNSPSEDVIAALQHTDLAKHVKGENNFD